MSTGRPESPRSLSKELPSRRTWLHLRAREDFVLQEGFTHVVGPESERLRWLEFGYIWLAREGLGLVRHTGGCEVVLVLQSGKSKMEITHQGASRVEIVSRESVFEAGPTLVCLPPKTRYEIESLGPGVQMAVCSAPVVSGCRATVLRPEDMETVLVGEKDWQREVRRGTVDLPDSTTHLLVGETIHTGGWSSFPPHKHDTDSPSYNPAERRAEEVYAFKIYPPTGFGVQVLLDHPDRPNARLPMAISVKDNDVVVLDRGYHPVAALPGHTIYYLWVMRGKTRDYGPAMFTTHPDFRWI